MYSSISAISLGMPRLNLEELAGKCLQDKGNQFLFTNLYVYKIFFYLLVMNRNDVCVHNVILINLYTFEENVFKILAYKYYTGFNITLGPNGSVDVWTEYSSRYYSIVCQKKMLIHASLTKLQLSLDFPSVDY